MKFDRRTQILLSLILLSGVGLGCSKSNEIERYPLTGVVTFNGEPITSGRLRLIPDKDAGNSGPGSVATIENGQFSIPKVRGVVGGQYKLEVKGYGQAGPASEDGEVGRGSSLFPPYESTAILPNGGEIRLNVPSTAVPAQNSRRQSYRR